MGLCVDMSMVIFDHDNAQHAPSDIYIWYVEVILSLLKYIYLQYLSIIGGHNEMYKWYLVRYFLK